MVQSDLIGARMTDEVRAAVQQLHDQGGADRLRPVIDHDALRRLPRGTFGRALVEFCAANHIIPARVSDTFDDEVLRRNAAIARYIAVHDMFHVLLGCGTSLPGELRITAFILEQRYFPASRLFLALLHVAGPLLRPLQARAVLANIRTGRALAQSAPLLLAEPLEDLFHEDLERLQDRLGLQPRA